MYDHLNAESVRKWAPNTVRIVAGEAVVLGVWKGGGGRKRFKTPEGREMGMLTVVRRPSK